VVVDNKSMVACFMKTWSGGKSNGSITNLSLSLYLFLHSATYDVQDAKIRGGAENISIQCVFAPGSQARGCHMKIRKTTVQVNKTRSGNLTEEQIVTGLTPGSYEVLIFDWEEDGSIATTPSHLDHVHLTGPADSSTPTSVSTTTGRRFLRRTVPITTIATK